MPNIIIHPTRSTVNARQPWHLRAGDDKRYTHRGSSAQSKFLTEGELARIDELRASLQPLWPFESYA